MNQDLKILSKGDVDSSKRVISQGFAFKHELEMLSV